MERLLTGKRIITILLIVALCLSFVPYQSYGETASSAKGFDLKSSLKKSTIEKYAKGEALILLEEDSKVDVEKPNKSVEQALDLPNDVSVEETYTFEEVTEADVAKSSKDEEVTDGADVVKVSSDNKSTETLVNELQEMPDVKYAEPNYRRSSSDLSSSNMFFGQQWWLNNTGQNGGTSGKDMKLGNIWGNANKGTNNDSTLVAVIDTGVDYTHPDLKNHMWTNTKTGKLAGKYGYNFSSGTTDPKDDNGHGTHVSGIIAGNGGSENGISGVDQGVKIMALKALDSDGFGWDADLLSAYEYIDKAISLGYDVKAVNNSWGGQGKSEIFKAIIETVGAKGCISVCAAGNEYSNIDGEEMVPAGIDSPYVVTVAASDESGQIADFSNTGKESVDIAAPGTSILSSVSYDVYNPTIYSTSKQAELSAVYKGFGTDEDLEGVKWQNWVDDAWDYSSDKNPLDTTTSAIERSNAKFFGDANHTNNSSLKWTIKNYDEDGVYNLFIPYTAQSSSVATQMSAAIQAIKGLKESDPDYYDGGIIITDTVLKDGMLPDSYKSLDTIDEDSLVDFTGLDESMNYWNNINSVVNPSIKKQTERALVFTFIADEKEEGANQEILLDDVGVSKGGDSTSALGRHAFYSGTSMAAPMVTGAVALLSDEMTNYSPEQLALEVGSMTNGDNSLSGKVSSGGNVDMTNYDSASPYIMSAKVSGSNVIISGVEFGTEKGSVKATPIAPSGTIEDTIEIAPTKWTDKAVTIPATNVKNRKVKFEVTQAGENGKTAVREIYVIAGKTKFKKEGRMHDGYDGSLTTDGKGLYYASAGGNIAKQYETYDYADDDEDETGPIVKVKRWRNLKSINPKTMFPDATPSELKSGTVYFDTELSYLNGRFYTIARLDTGHSFCYALAAYDVKKNNWYRIADRPGMEINEKNTTEDFKNVQMSSLAAYNGKIYLMGGMDTENNIVSNKVRVYNLSTKKWTAGVSMKEGRYLGVARQVGDKLVVSLGGNDQKDNSATRPLIFNGKTWTYGKAIDAPMTNSVYYAMTDENDENAETEKDPETGETVYYRTFNYYNAAVGIIKGGLVYSGLSADKLGDTYAYSLGANKYNPSAHQLNEKGLDEDVIGIAVGAKMFVAKVSDHPIFIDEDYDDEEEDIDIDEEDEEVSEVHSMPVQSGLLSVTTNNSKGTVTGLGKYLPGQKVTVKVTMKKKYKKKYKFKSMKIYGKTIKKSSYTIPAITKNTYVTTYYKKR